MASPPPSLLLPFLLLLLLVLANVAQSYVTPRPTGNCGEKCSYRCSATAHKKACLYFCVKCCAQCRCVPPGTYGNKHLCPCYSNWKTKEGRPKCP